MTRCSDPVVPVDLAGAEKTKDLGHFVTQRLLESRSIIISRQVDRQLMERVAAALLVLEAEDADKPITVYVNSPGGDADSGFAIYDLLHFARPPVRSICAGLSASAGVPIYLGADKGSRFCLPHSRFLLHQPSMQMMGQASDLDITANEITRVRQRYNQIISVETGQPVEKVSKDADRDFWLSADEALQYGLVDRIIRHRGEMD